MSSAQAFRMLATASRQRGLPAIGVELEAPARVQLVPIANGNQVVMCREVRTDGASVGELDLAMFKALLVVDRDGVLENKARELAAAAAPGMYIDDCRHLDWQGVSGFRVSAHARGIERPPLPYVNVIALAPEDLRVGGGIVITVRSARLEWDAGNEIINSIKVLGRRITTVNEED